MPEIIIRVTSMQVTLLPTREGGFVGTLAATLTAGPASAPSVQASPASSREPDAPAPRVDDRPMSDAQRRMLWRLAMQLGHQGEAAAGFLRTRLGVKDIGEATKVQASRLITALEVESRGNGKEPGHAAP